MPSRVKRWASLGVAVVAVGLAPYALGEPPRKITIDGKFDDWAEVRSYSDPAGDEHDTDHKGKAEEPKHVEHPDADLLEYKLGHDAANLYFYFRARGVIGRTLHDASGKRAGRYYAIGAIDVDENEKTGYWLHEGGFYPTSGGYDMNAEIEWYDNEFNTGHYINHECTTEAELDQAFLDQSSKRYKKGHDGPYKAGFIRLGAGTYKHYTEYVYHDNGTVTFVRDKGPVVLGIVKGKLSPDGHQLEMRIPFRGFLVDERRRPIMKRGQTLKVSMSLEASGELAPGKDWASDAGEPIEGYVLEGAAKK